MGRPVTDRYLFRELLEQRQSEQPLKLSSTQWKNVRQLFKVNRGRIAVYLALTIALTIVEGLLPLMIKTEVADEVYELERIDSLIAFSVVVLTLFNFASVRFIQMYNEKWLLIDSLNRIRRAWYGRLVGKKSECGTDEVAKITTKITFHFNLLQMGVRNAVLLLPGFIVMTVLLLVVSAIIDTWLFWATATATAFSFVLMAAGYFIARRYVSKDQTLYSRILNEIQRAVYNRTSLQSIAGSAAMTESIDALVDLDSYFRIRRELWVRFTPQVIFILAILAVAASFYLDAWGGNYSRLLVTDAAAVGFVSAFSLRQMRNALLIGLFAIPLHLGSVLCIPTFSLTPQRPWLDPPESLSLRTSSFRVQSDGPRKRYQWDFSKGQRVRFETSEDYRRVIRVIRGGLDNQDGKAWVTVHNGDRCAYNQWKHGWDGPLIVSSTYREETPLAVILTGQMPDEIDGETVDRVFGQIESLPNIQSFNLKVSDLRCPVVPERFGWERLMAIQVVAAIINEPAMVIVDPVVSRYPSELLETLLRDLERDSDRSILIGFENYPAQPNRSYAI